MEWHGTSFFGPKIYQWKWSYFTILRTGRWHLVITLWVFPKIEIPQIIHFSRVIISHPFWGTPIFGNTLVDFWKVTIPEVFRVLPKWLTTWGLWHFRPLTTWGTKFTAVVVGCFVAAVHMGKTYNLLPCFMTFFFVWVKVMKKGFLRVAPFSFLDHLQTKISLRVQSEILFCPSKSTVGNGIGLIMMGQILGYPNKSSPRNGKKMKAESQV